MAAPTIVAFGSGTNGTNSTTVSVTLPTNTQGDLLFVAIVQDGQPTSLTATNWTPLYNLVDIQTTAKLSVLYKTAGAGESSPVTFTSSLSERMVWVAWSVRGHNGIHTSAGTPSTGSSATVSFPSISTSVADCRAFTVIGTDNLSLPHGVSTNYASVDTEELTSGGALSVASRALSGTGTESPASVSITNEQWTSVTFAVAPSGTGSNYSLTAAASAATATPSVALGVTYALSAAASAATATPAVTLDVDTGGSPVTYTDGYGGDVTTYQDTGLDVGNPNNNMGASTSLRVYHGGGSFTNRALLRFDLSAIPSGATCNSATLYLTNTNTLDATCTIGVYAIAAANTGWTEGAGSGDSGSAAATGESTWNNRAHSGTSWAGSAGLGTAGTDYNSTALGSAVWSSTTSGQTVTASLDTTTVASWFGTTNPGLLLREIGDNWPSLRIASSDHATTGWRPKLVVEYVGSGGPQTYDLTLAATATTTTGSVTLSGGVEIDVLRLPSGALTRNPANPLIDNGPQTYDALKAGPRHIVKVGASDYRMIYEAIADDGNLTTVAAYATSTDGDSWAKYASNPVMTDSEAWEGPEVAPTCWFYDPDVLGGKYVLFYHGGGNSIQRQIGVATADSLTGPWTKYASNPILSYGSSGAWDAQFVADAKVVKLGTGSYVMFYYGVPASGGGRIGRATASSVFGPWTKDAGNPVFGYGAGGAWDDDAVQSPGLVYVDGVYHMWYVGDDGANEALGYAYSADGQNWTRGPQNPVLTANAPELIGDTVAAYLDSNVFRVQYGRFDFSGSPERQIAEATYTMATHRMSIIGWQVKIDTANIFFEPYTVKATNDAWKHFALVFKDTATRDVLYGTFEVPENYVGAPKVKVVWTSTGTTGNVVWDFDYRAIGGTNTESFDQATAQESVTVTSAAPGATDRRMVAEMALTAANLSAGDTVEFLFGRDGASASDTLAAAVTVHAILFEFSDN